MLFLIRTFSLCALSAIIIFPLWSFDRHLDQAFLVPAVGGKDGLAARSARIASADFSYRVTAALQGLKAEIHDDMCRHPVNYHLISPKLCGGATGEATRGRPLK